MFAFFPFIAVVISAANTLYEKSIFNRKRRKYKFYVPLIFFFSFLILSIFVFPFLGDIKIEAFQPIFILLLLAIVVLATLANLLYYRGFQREQLSEIQPFVVMSPLLTVVIASIIYPDERNWRILVLALVAAVTLIASHIEKRHLKIDKGIIFIIGAVLLGAIETNIVKELLYFYSPVALYTIRTGLVALVLFIVVKPFSSYTNRKKIIPLISCLLLKSKRNKEDIEIVKDIKKLFLVSIAWVSIMTLVYYSYQNMGIVYTALIMMVVPLLVVFGGHFILKERKPKKRDVFALIVVLGCVILAQLID